MFLTDKSNDEIRDGFRAYLLEAESRRPRCRLLKALHRAARLAEEQAFEDGQVSTLSDPGGKELP